MSSILGVASERVMKGFFSPHHSFGKAVFWLCFMGYCLHVIEEYDLGWQPWAVQVLGLPVTWGDFYITNGFGVIPLGIVAGSLGWGTPAVSLLLPGVMLVNAVVFHMLPSLNSGAYSPGLITALALFLPLGGWCFTTAWLHERSTLKLVIPGSILLMAFPVVMLKLKPLLGY